jgi:hypothetical protein
MHESSCVSEDSFFPKPFRFLLAIGICRQPPRIKKTTKYINSMRQIEATRIEGKKLISSKIQRVRKGPPDSKEIAKKKKKKKKIAQRYINPEIFNESAHRKSYPPYSPIALPSRAVGCDSASNSIAQSSARIMSMLLTNKLEVGSR